MSDIPATVALKKNYLFWLIALFSLTILVLSAGIAVQKFLDPAPFPTSYWDVRWALIFSAMIILIGLAFRIARGRVLLGLLALTIISFLALTAVTTEAGAAYLVLCWLFVLSVAVGRRLLNWLVPRAQLRLLEWLLLALLLGLGLIMVLTMIQGWLHAFSSLVTWTGLLLLTAVFIVPQIRPAIVFLTRTLARLRRDNRDRSGLALTLGVGAFLFIGSWMIALAPPMRYDEMVYHLTAPLYYLQNGGIVPYPEGGTIVWPHYAEMLYTLAIQTAGLSLPRLVHLSMGVISAGFVFVSARRLLNARAGVIAALLFFATPFIGYEMGTAYIDLFVTAHTTAAGFSVLLWLQEKNPRWLAAAGIFGGMGLGIKLTAGPMIGGLLVFILLIALFEKSLYRSIPWVVVMGALVVALALPWLLRDALWTGDPFYPYGGMFLNKVGVSADSAQPAAAGPTAAQEVYRYLRYPLELVVNSSRYYHESAGGMAGALPLLAVPFFVFDRSLSRRVKIILIGLLFASLIALAIKMIVNSLLARYAMPVFPWMALSAAASLDYLYRQVNAHRQRSIALAGMLIIALAYLLSTRLPLVVRIYENLPQRFPVNFILGRESREEYLSRNLVVYDGYQYIDSQPGDRKRVLTVGSEFRLYTNAFIGSVYDVHDSRRMVANARSPEDLANRMAQAGYDYIFINHPEVDFRQWKYYTPFPVFWQTDFLDLYARLEFAQKGIYVYRFIPQGANLPAPVNLLQNPGFEESQADSSVAGWHLEGAVDVSTLALEGSQSLSLGAPLSPEGFGYAVQRVGVIPDEIYTLGYWLRADQPAVFLMRVYWLDESGNLISTEERWKNVGQDWEWHVLYATSPPDAAYAEVVVSFGGSQNGYVDEVCFAQGQRCPLP